MTTPVFAQAAAAAPADSLNFMSFVPIVLIIGVMYFLLIRPQQKKARQHQDMLSTLRRGDKIITSGGIIATIIKVANDQELEIEISEGVRVRLLRAMVADVTNRATGVDSVDATPRPKEEKTSSKVQKLPVKSKTSTRKPTPDKNA